MRALITIITLASAAGNFTSASADPRMEVLRKTMEEGWKKFERHASSDALTEIEAFCATGGIEKYEYSTTCIGDQTYYAGTMIELNNFLSKFCVARHQPDYKAAVICFVKEAESLMK